MPASDVLLKGKITQECHKATGITLKLETINANDLQARITSAIQSGTGPDIIMSFGNWPQLYRENLVDVGEIVEEIGKAQGGYYDVAEVVTKYLITDMYAKAIQGMPAKAAVEWTYNEIAKVYV